METVDISKGGMKTTKKFGSEFCIVQDSFLNNFVGYKFE